MGNVKKKKFRVPFLGKFCTAMLGAVIAVAAMSDGAELVSATGSSIDSATAALQAENDKLKQQNEERKKQIESIKGDISGNKEAMQLITDQINGIIAEKNTADELITMKIGLIEEKSAQIDAVILTISDKEHEIDVKRDEIADLREENKQNLEKFAKLARAMYMKNSSDTIPVLNGSDDWYDFFVYSDVVKNISGQNVLFMQRLQNSIAQQETLIGELDRSIAKLQEDKADLERQKADYEKEKTDLEEERKRLNANANEQRAYLNQLAAKNKQFENQVNSLEIKISENNKQIEENNAEIDRLIWLAQQENQGQTIYNDGTFLWPVPSKYQKITTKFGYDSWRGGMHNGVDITGNVKGEIHNANIYAAQTGTVILTYTECTHYGPKSTYHSCGSGYGNYIVIDHGGGVTTLYGHCENVNVVKGQHVKKGDIIGTVGSTGWSTGYHLHFEVRVNNVKKDPLTYTKYQYI